MVRYLSAHNFERPYKRPRSLLTFPKPFREYSEWFPPGNSRLLRPDGALFQLRSKEYDIIIGGCYRSSRCVLRKVLLNLTPDMWPPGQK